MSSFISMQNSNNNWFILDSLGNIKICANLNHFWITQSELCLKDMFVEVSFMFVTIFLGIYENPRIKNYINPFCAKHPAIINRNKKCQKFLFFTLLCGTWKKVLWRLDGNRKKCLDKILCPLPPFLGLEQQKLRLCFCWTSQLIPFP